MRILVVEDNDSMRRMYEHTIPMIICGADIFFAENGKEGIEKALAHKPDLIILDGIMPIMGGMETLRRLKECDETKKIPVFIISGTAGKIKAEAIEHGALVVLQKPVTTEELSKVMMQNINA